MQKRIISSIILSTVVILVILGIISYLYVRESIERSMENRLSQSNIIGEYVDYILETNLKRLYDISISGKIDFTDNNWEPERTALRTAYEYSIFTDRIFLLDLYGNLVLKYPHQEDAGINILSIPYVSRALMERKQIISDVYVIEPTMRKVILTLVPLKDKTGDIIGIAGGEINPTNYVFINIIKSFSAGNDTTVELVDSYGTIIASNDTKRVLSVTDYKKYFSRLFNNKKPVVERCHRCHIKGTNENSGISEDVIAFSPLSNAPWGILIREPQEVVFRPARNLKKGFLIIGLVFVASVVLLAVGMNKSIITPLRMLISETDKIGKGNLSEPIMVRGRDEIGVLARSFEHMRVRLGETLERLQEQNALLEQRVMESTQDIRESQKMVRSLLKKTITSAEDERKRIARELHDDILQEISVILMNIDMCRLYPEKTTTDNIEKMRDNVLKIRSDITRIIQNLRPSALDDLGLKSSINWLLDRHLKSKGIVYFLTMDEEVDSVLDTHFKTTLFRILQEAIINIARHSGAENAFIVIKMDKALLSLYIEDDGTGFDAKSMLKNPDSDGRGLGLIGMKERAALIGGTLKICSSSESGTVIQLTFNLSPVLQNV